MAKRAMTLVLALWLGLGIASGQEAKRFALPKGFDPNSPEAVLDAGNAAYAEGDRLKAAVYFRRYAVFPLWDEAATSRLREIEGPAALELAALPPAQRTEYERFAASVLAPELLAREPEMRTRLRALLGAGDEEAAGGTAEALAKIFPSDAEAAAALAARRKASLKNARKAFEAGAVLTAWERLAAVPDADPARKKLAGRIQKALTAHNDLQGALIAEDAGLVQSAMKALKGAYPRDTLLTVMEKWKARPAGMVLVPGGAFMMGCTSGDAACNLDEFPAHRVAVRPFYLDQTEVTVEAYGRCVEAGTCAAPISQEKNTYCNWGRKDRANHPVNCVYWSQADAYCRWAGKRLPSEAEWEYAARGGHNAWTYPWGDEPADCSRAVMSINGDGCGRGSTWPAGSKGTNEYGLFGMAGNVYEWMDDCVHTDYFGAPADGSAWLGDPCTHRVARGGSWYTRAPESLRVSVRSGSVPDMTDHSMGFRCAKD